VGLIADISGIISLFKKEPPALAITPDTAKLSLDLPLIGRDNDLQWLQVNEGDCVLVGQPGSGKTFLLYKFAKQGNGLFVNDFNIGRITREYKRKKPKTIIIDDAQLHLDLIHKLVNYRKNNSATFRILASCWPNHEAMILIALNLPASNSHYLNLLTLDQLVEVVKAVGLMGPDGLIQEIVEQSVGRPGLAVSLTNLCLKEGGVQDIVLGNALAGWVTTKLLPETNSKYASAILASFAIGGNTGMPLVAIANGLGLTLLEVQEVISNLVGGLIFDNTPNLVVYPPALRHSLVGDKFFRGAVSLPITEFIRNAPSLHDVASTLMGARRRGANIPQELLVEQLEQVNAGDLWEEFAYLGESEVTWILENKPQFLVSVARPALLHAPTKGIPLLLNSAIGDERELHSSTDHPVRIIQDWVLSAYPGKGQAIKQRKILLDSVTEWMNVTENSKPGIRTLQIIMTPEFFFTSTSPGSGNTVTLRSGHLTAPEIDSLKDVWPEVLAIITNATIQDWAPIRQTIETWAYPGRLGSVLPEVYDDMRAFASKMILDMLPTISKHAGLLHWAQHVVRTANLSIMVPVDSTFEILYPEVDISDFHTDSTEQMVSVIKLAQSWNSKKPDDVMKELSLIEKEAQLAGHSWPRLTPLFSQELSKIVDNQISWVEAGIKAGVPGDLVTSFIKKFMGVREKGWVSVVQRWLQEPTLTPYVVELILTGPNVPKALLDKAFSKLENLDGLIEVLCLRGLIPEDRVLKLLKHDDPEIALAAAKGEWHADPIKKVRVSLEKQWDQVIINFLTEDYLLGEIFVERPSLAATWLSARIQEASKSKNQIAGLGLERAFGIAANSLEFEERRSLLKTISSSPYDYLIVTHLIGNNIELYKELLANVNLKHLHLDPLYGKPNDAWVLKALAAMESGYSPRDVAHATKWGNMKLDWFSGNESEMWDDWIKTFEPYLQHDDEKIRDVAKISIENARLARDKALREEQQEAVFGRN